jgi:hypothetical protein
MHNAPARVREYEREAESLIVEAVNASPEALARIEGRLRSFREAVQADLNKFLATPTFDEFARRCTIVLEYLDKNLQLIHRLGHLYAEDQINHFEEQMYQLLDRSNKTDRADVAGGTTLRDAILELMKQLGSYRTLVAKKKADDRRVLDRLEDLQENLANFEYEVSAKFGWDRSLQDKAQDLLKSRIMDDATKAHERIDGDMFAL